MGMEGPEMDALMADIEELQLEQPTGGVSQAPAGVIMRSYTAQASEVELRYLSSSDPDRRKRSVESRLRKLFESQWSDKANQAYVSDVFIIGQYGATAMQHKANFEQYAREKGGKAQTFHGTLRLCKTAEHSSIVHLCHVHGCHLCSIMRYSFSMKKVGSSSGTWFGHGMYSSQDSYKASKYEKSERAGQRKHTLLLCSIVPGVKEFLYKPDPNKRAPSYGYDSVEAVPGPNVRWSETVIFKEKGMLPHALITFDYRTHVHSGPSTKVNDGDIFTIVNTEFGHAIEFDPNSGAVQGMSPNGSTNQQWIFREQATGGWMLESEGNSGKFLGLESFSTQKSTLCSGVSLTDAVVWEIQPAASGTFRIAIYDKLSKCVDMSKSDGNAGRLPARVWIWDHLQDFKNQRWTLQYIGHDNSPNPTASQPPGQNGPTQTPVDGGVYFITNEKFNNTAIDLNQKNNDVQGWHQNNRPNQHWVFHKAPGGGWHISSESNGMYLGLRNATSRQKGNRTKASTTPDVAWDIQAAYKGSVRIAPIDAPTTSTLDMNIHNKNEIILWSFTRGAHNQRWYLQRIG